jgi:hypothetical protein
MSAHTTRVITIQRRMFGLVRTGWKPTCRTCPWRGRDTTSPLDAARAGDAHREGLR